MKKMRMESPDLAGQNIEKIGALFHKCITETVENGKLLEEHMAEENGGEEV